MKALITAYQLVRKRKAGHETALLEPKDGAEGAAEEDALDACKCYKSLNEGGVGPHPLESPLGLAFNRRDSIDGLKEACLLLGILDELIDHK